MNLSIPLDKLLALSYRDMRPVRFNPAGRLRGCQSMGRDGASLTDRLALEHAVILGRKSAAIQANATAYGAPWFSQPPPANTGWNAVASTASEAGLFQGAAIQPAITAFALDPALGTNPLGRRFWLKADGVFSNTGTPTLIFQARLGTTAGVTTYSGTSIAQSAAITTTSGVTNVGWTLWLEIMCFATGQGSSGMTLTTHGWVESPAGFASPFKYLMAPASGTPATWHQASFDASVVNYLNLSVTWSASSASNTLTMKDCYGMQWN
jgi:hypothetical protein